MVNFFKHSNKEIIKFLMPETLLQNLKKKKVATFHDIFSPVSSYMPLLTQALLYADLPCSFS